MDNTAASTRSGVKGTLLDIWRDVLRRSQISEDDDFFALGGHSLNATQVVSQIRVRFGLELSLREIFDYRSIAELARVIQIKLGQVAPGLTEARSPTIDRKLPLPVSSSQRRMWLIHALDPEGAAYNMHEALRLRGPLDRAALQVGLDALVARHEAFRMRFVFNGSEPAVVLGSPSTAVIDLLDGAHSQSDLMALATARAIAPFNLECGPLHRFILTRFGDDDHLFVLVMHHIISDDWSGAILIRELQELYGAARRGRATVLTPKSLDLMDYVAWQRLHIDEAALSAQAAYWLDRLAGMSPLNLPTDIGKTRRLSSQGSRVRIPLSAAWLQQLQIASSQLGATPFMTLLATFQALLSRWCGQSDIAVGFPIANRMRTEAENVVGCLVNTLVLRSDVESGDSFRNFVKGKVRDAVLEAFANQDVPYDNLIERLRDSGKAGQNPEVRVLFNVLNSPREPLAFADLEVNYAPLNLLSTQFDLGLDVDTEGERALYLSYSTELFHHATIEGLARSYLHAVDLALREPDVPLAALWAARPKELARIAQWNATKAHYPETLNIACLLAANRTCGAKAVVAADGTSLSYRDLWGAVDDLSHTLRQQGIRRGKLVGLSLDRGLGMVVALLAVLQAGAAYVPLDPSYPQQRLHAMADDAGLALLIAEPSLSELWKDLYVPKLMLDLERTIGEAESTQPSVLEAMEEARPDDPAYVIYTSGSTGKPKGVVVPHRAVINFLCSMKREPGMHAKDTLLAVTTLSFDIAVLELLLPLFVGATVHLASREEGGDGRALLRRLQTSDATLMQATPATWRMLLDAGWRGGKDFKALVGGEPLSSDLARMLLDSSGEVWNMYGPTETTVWSTCWRLHGPLETISIGAPIANTQIHVLDAEGRPCPIGFSGELFIGGDGVTLGYLNRPNLTAERFVPDPFSSTVNATMYRTGDRGRWRWDGTLEHQGRLDFQVKVRGYRIELGEIESQLDKLEGVAQSLAIVREDSMGDPRLVAYVVPRAEGVAPSALREILRSVLPAYMIPQHFVLLSALPRLPNGKIDRRLLPLPSEEASPSAQRLNAPQTPAERALASIWTELLGIVDVRRSDNFFDLGGHSLLANRAVIAFERAVGTRLALRRLILESLSQLAAGINMPVEIDPAATRGQTPSKITLFSKIAKRLSAR